jgi:1-acyl-sn-glycerol-3-phosphate acyltransferase
VSWALTARDGATAVSCGYFIDWLARSQMACLNDCREMLRQGGSVLFFPEGTRSTTGEMDSFKKGAFSVAAKERVPVVPITLIGTGQILTNGAYACVQPPVLPGPCAASTCPRTVQ